MIPTPVRAQSEFPSRPIKLIVPFPAGGGIDVTARVVAQGFDLLTNQIGGVDFEEQIRTALQIETEYDWPKRDPLRQHCVMD